MKRTWLGSVLAIMVLIVSPAVAAEWGTWTTASIADVFVGNGQRNSRSVGVGGASIPVATVTLDDSVSENPGVAPFDRGIAQAFTGLRFGANRPPNLKAEGFLTGNSSGVPHNGQTPIGAAVDASAFASDLFRYTGSMPTTLSINFSLEGIVSENPLDLTESTGIFAQVAVLADTPNYQFDPFLGNLVFEQGATLLGSELLEIKEDTAGALASRLATLSFNVNPGDTFYVWQKLNISAVRNTRFADAFHTLSSKFSEPEHVRSLSGIPEPATVMLSGLGLVSFVGLVSRRRRPLPGSCCN
jgi:PEP-CTERM motif